MEQIVKPDTIEWFLTHATENAYPSRDALAERLGRGKIRAYLGVDPSGPTLHLGHAIALKKLGELQSLGHEIILLIGDFTAMIGDPTDKSATRKPLTREQVLDNAKRYKEQSSRFLRFDGENPAKIMWNSAWLDRLTFLDVIGIAAHFTVQQMLERDMFEKRMAEGKPVHLHEFLYPMMQGYDSVAMDVDLEIGGNDQTFNMLAGRDLMHEMKGKDKYVLTVRLLADPSGKKMGKSEGNMIALADAPEDMYGKVMSWPDTMIVSGFEICTDKTGEEIGQVRAALEQGENPMKWKRFLAWQIVFWLQGEEAANRAAEHFTNVHQEHEAPEDVLVVPVGEASVRLADALVLAGLVESKNEARRQVEQGAVKVDGKIAQDANAVLEIPANGLLLQKGKRHFARLKRSDL